MGTVVSGTVVCSTPSSNAAGLVNFVLRNRSEGRVDGDVFKYEYYAMPTISGVFPGVGLVRGGSVVSVRGTGFITEEGLACRFGGLVVSGAGARLETSTVVACIAPKPREEGAVAVEISLNGGVDYTSSGKQFVYQSNPTVDSLSLIHI